MKISNLEWRKLKKEFSQFVSKDDLRPNMTHIVFKEATSKLYATDAHKMKFKDYFPNCTFDWAINLKILNSIIQSKIGFEVGVKDKTVTFTPIGEGNPMHLTMENYPNYECVIPEGESTSTCKLIINITKLRGLAGLANSFTKTIKLSIKDGDVLLSSECIDFESFGKYRPIQSEVYGEDIDININGTGLIKILGSANTDGMLSFKFRTPSSAIIINDNTLIMPSIN